MRLQQIEGDNSRDYDPDRTVAVLVSGGVDSSVSVLKLREQGWRVVGVNMRIPLACGSGSVDGSAAEEVCRKLEIPLFRIDLSQDFRSLVIDHFHQEYLKGRTPNPCVDCNARLKFGLVWDLCEKELGVRYLATGHYAVVEHRDGHHLLRQAGNISKDQSYFIYGVPMHRLPFLLLPLGEMVKEQTRAIAADAGLPSADKPESMELCFAGGGDYRCALPEGMRNEPGDFINIRGETIGRHTGVCNYTVGQRKLGVSLGEEPHYVLQIIPGKNTIIAGTRQEAMCRTVEAEFKVIHLPEELKPDQVYAGKIRSGSQGRECRLVKLEGNRARVEFSESVFAPTPGQHLVLYNRGMAVIAGGTIESGPSSVDL